MKLIITETGIIWDSFWGQASYSEEAAVVLQAVDSESRRGNFMNSRASILCVIVVMLMSIFTVAADESRKVLLAVDSSEFKDQLAYEITDLAESEQFKVSVLNSVKKIKDKPLDEYAAVVVLNRGMAGHMNRNLIKLLKEGDYPGMVIITTYAEPGKSKDRYEDYREVDGISTASLKTDSDISKMAQDVLISLKKILR